MIAVGIALYLLAAEWAVGRERIMPTAMRRILAVHDFLERQSAVSQFGDVYVLGSSVSIEGIDCGILDTKLGPRHAYHLGWTGGTVRQATVILPALTRARPALAIYASDVGSIDAGGEIPLERLAIGAWWDFVDPELVTTYSEIWTPFELRRITRRDPFQLVDFRAFPLARFDESFREVSRSDLRYQGYESNFKAPWVQRQPISEAAWKRYFALLAKNRPSPDPEGMQRSLKALQFSARQLSAVGAKTMFVLSPLHPDLAADLERDQLPQVRAAVAAAAKACGAIFVDHSRALTDPAVFGDPIHPFAPGRQRWSELLADEAAAALKD